MKLILLIILAICSLQGSYAQIVKYQTDQHIVNQQERMVYKQWDRRKFTPTKGFLGLNPNYWLTWAWHPNYPKTDLRPLSASGPQTQRLLLVAAMKNTADAHKLQTDSIRNLALSEIASYTPTLSAIDPLWQLYYQNELRLLTDPVNPLLGASPKVQNYLSANGLIAWYTEEINALAQRLNSARSTNMERGSRILTYHNILQEFRKLHSAWETKKQRAELYLQLSEVNENVKVSERFNLNPAPKSDQQIAEEILSKTKL